MEINKISTAYHFFSCPTCGKTQAINVNWETLTYDCVHCFHKHNTIYKAFSKNSKELIATPPVKVKVEPVDEKVLQNNLDFLKFLHDSGIIEP